MKNNHLFMHTQCWAVDLIYHSFFVHIVDQIQQVILSTTKCVFRTYCEYLTSSSFPVASEVWGTGTRTLCSTIELQIFFNFKANVANGTNVSTLLSVLSGLSHLALHIFVMMQLRAAKAGANSII